MTPNADAASKGGVARAQSLTKEQRSAIARKAVAARWEKAGKSPAEIAQAEYGSPDSPLRIGDLEIPCYVLADGRRVLHQRGMVSALGMSRGSSSTSGGDRLAKFVQGDRLQPYVSSVLDPVTKPIKFYTTRGQLAYGYEATVLADICEAVLKAREEGKLQSQQLHIAQQCEILVRGFARVGIIALVDEATGYQDARARDALAKILEAFVAKELRKWVRTFPADFYKEMFRLRGLPYTGKVQLPSYIGHLTNDLVYSRLAPGVLEELKRKSPKDESGRRKNKLFMWLTEDVGHPKLLQHLEAVKALMKVSTSWEQFKEMLDRAYPKQTPLPLFDGLE
jgi:hypothetical protein